jgi:hypothetical protein
MEIQSPALSNLIATVDRCIRDATAARLSETATLLRMARLDLIARVHGISEEEMDVFLFVVESDQRLADHMAPPELQQARRKAAEQAGKG